MKIALIQMNSQPNRDHNLAEVARLLNLAVAFGKPDLIVLPEHFDWTGGTPAERQKAADLVPGGAAYELVRRFAERHQVWIHAGSLLERNLGDPRIFNTTVVFAPSGRQVGLYRKIHLFDINAPDGKQYLESATVAPGDSLLIYEVGGLRIACAICYDLRFSPLFDRLASLGVDVFILPAAFTRQTGKDHWEVLCRARAIEFQAYFVACGQCGSYPGPDGEDRFAFGQSMVCDPWGHVIARAGNTPEVLTAVLDRERIRQVREWIPMASHRVRLDGMEVVEAR